MRRRPRKTHLLLAVAPDNEDTILGIVGTYGAMRTALRTLAELHKANIVEFKRTGDPHWLNREYAIRTMEVR